MYLKYYLQYLAQNYDWVISMHNHNYRFQVMSLKEYEKEVKRREKLK